MKIERATFAGLLFSLVVLALSVAAPCLSPAYAQEGKEDEQRRRPAQTLDPSTAVVLQKVFEYTQNEQYQQALAELNKLVNERGDRMKAFDKATTYQMRGSVKASLEDYRGALRDFEAALQLGALPPEQNDQLRYYIAQLYFQIQDYQAAIRGLQEWIRLAQAAGVKVDCNAYYLLAAAYTQIEPANYRAALQPAEQSVACLTEPKKGNYDLLNLVYSELNESAKRASLLERMINFWPGERSYWTQLSGLYSTMGKDGDAFAVLEVAYRSGLLNTEAQILTLVQYYSYFDNPYRGAKLLEREMQSGTVKRTEKNLTLLSQLWSQAREHKRAIPVLQEAARLSDKGELSYRLGQVLLADEQYAASEKALRTALNKGGMNERQTGDCWLLLGTAIFSQAGPGDRDIRKRAREAFVRAQKYPEYRRQASQWVAYIDAIEATERAQDELERQQRAEARRAEIERLKTAAQVCRLQGGGAECESIVEQIKKLESEAEAAPSGESAPPPADASVQGEEASEAPPESQ